MYNTYIKKKMLTRQREVGRCPDSGVLAKYMHEALGSTTTNNKTWVRTMRENNKILAMFPASSRLLRRGEKDVKT